MIREFFRGANSKDEVAEMLHPKLGNSEFEDEGWWKEIIETELGFIDIFVRGTAELVDETSADYCFYVASNLKEYYKKALVRLVTRSKKKVSEIGNRSGHAYIVYGSLKLGAVEEKISKKGGNLNNSSAIYN